MAKKKINAGPYNNLSVANEWDKHPTLRGARASHRRLFGDGANIRTGRMNVLGSKDSTEIVGRLYSPNSSDENAWNMRPRPVGSNRDIHLPTRKKKEK